MTLDGEREQFPTPNSQLQNRMPQQQILWELGIGIWELTLTASDVYHHDQNSTRR
jgi:hypothetical protein